MPDESRPLYVQIPDDLDLRLRRFCLENDRQTLSAAVAEAIREFLDRREIQPAQKGVRG